ncbi:protoporphyrinogen oxidase [Propionibacterium acidifaciens]|uniref:protoporphyrinogen oxidase n=1 Tax=Propionibacterium acidifaciens TaxID=556499 RepID=UPI000F4D756D|nr:protoporphyrinogen oxidase [Propionibacterium acidifaciens]AYW77481.1 protoporphyrinogen oxidase [Propionibacterium acidifaciens]
MSGADDDGCAGPRLVVVGGGITGLSAAWQGAARGARVTVLEASGRFGGKIVTERRDGFVIEGGPDSYVAYRPALARLLDELGIADEVIAPGGGRRAALLARGALRPMPAGMGMVLPTRLWPFVTTRVLGWPDKLRAGLDLVIPRRLRDGRDVSIGAFLRSRLGDGIVDRYAEVMVGGIYGARVDELSLDAVLPSLRRNEREHRSLMVASLAQGRAARRGRATARGAVGSPFRSLRGGLGRVVEALVEGLGARGVELRAGAAAARLTDAGVELADGSLVPADAVVLAGGAACSALLLAGPAPDAAAVLDAIPLASTTVVSLGFRVDDFDRPPDSQGWLEVDPGPVSGVTTSSVKYAGRAPDGQALVRVFIPDKRGPLTGAPDDELLPAVLDHVRPLLGVHGEPTVTRIDRWHAVMPKYTVGHLDRVAAVDGWLAAHRPTWAVAGSALHGVGLPECVADGRARADAVLDAAAGRARGEGPSGAPEAGTVPADGSGAAVPAAKGA